MTSPRATHGRRKRSRIAPLSAVVLASFTLACGDAAPDPNASPAWELPTAKAAGSTAKPAVPPGAATPEKKTVIVAPAADNGPLMRDGDFTESEHNRDPFRSFEAEFKPKIQHVAQRSVLMPNTPVEGMKLIAIVMGLSQPRAMLVDEKGVGYVTTRGDFIGRADVVQGGGPEGLPVTLNWRIERIRDNEVVLSREDPSAPGRPPLTRIIPLREAAVNDDEGNAG